MTELHVHPAAEKLPLMGGADLAELAEDIKAHGLQEPIILFSANGEEPQLLDGRNRLAALRLLGITDFPTRTVIGVDPEVFVTSMNVYRRHLSAAQKRDYVKALIAIDPKASNRKVARKAGVSDTFVGDVRKEESDRNAAEPQTDQSSPVDRAKAAILADPNASQRTIAVSADVGQATVNKARKELIDSGEIVLEPPAVDKPKAKPKAKAAPKPKVQKPKPPSAGTVKINEIATVAEELRKIVKEVNRCTLTEDNIKVVRELAEGVRETYLAMKALQAKE